MYNTRAGVRKNNNILLCQQCNKNEATIYSSQFNKWLCFDCTIEKMNMNMDTGNNVNKIAKKGKRQTESAQQKQEQMEITTIAGMEKLYTVVEAIEYLKISRNALYTYIRTGKIKANRIGDNTIKNKHNTHQWRIPESAIVEFVNKYGNTGKRKSKNEHTKTKPE